MEIELFYPFICPQIYFGIGRNQVHISREKVNPSVFRLKPAAVGDHVIDTSEG